MSLYTKKIRESLVEGTPFKEVVLNIIDNGACQCFGDCDCYKRKGEVVGTETKYTNPISSKWYSSLKACKEAYEAKNALKTYWIIVRTLTNVVPHQTDYYQEFMQYEGNWTRKADKAMRFESDEEATDYAIAMARAGLTFYPMHTKRYH